MKGSEANPSMVFGTSNFSWDRASRLEPQQPGSFPQGTRVLIPGTCACVTLYGKRASAVVIK